MMLAYIVEIDMSRQPKCVEVSYHVDTISLWYYGLGKFVSRMGKSADRSEYERTRRLHTTISRLYSGDTIALVIPRQTGCTVVWNTRRIYSAANIFACRDGSTGIKCARICRLVGAARSRDHSFGT